MIVMTPPLPFRPGLIPGDSIWNHSCFAAYRIGNMEKLPHSVSHADDEKEVIRAPLSAGSVVRFPAWVPYAIAAGFMLLGLLDTWWVHSLRTDLLAVRGSLQSHQWQVTEESERQGLADLRVVPLDTHDPATKDPAFSAARIAVAWNARLHQGMITARNIPPPPAGHDYQFWVLDPGATAPINAGLLAATGGSQDFSIKAPTTGQVGFAVSLEPAGGSPEPTGPILFAVAPGQW